MIARSVFKPSASSGFTLIEVVVALTLTALLVAVGMELLRAAGASQERLGARRLTWDRDQNARRWLDDALRGARTVGVGEAGFVGEPDQLALPTRLQTAIGRDTASVWIGVQQDRLLARSPALAELVLWHDVEEVAFDYLIEPGLDSRWVQKWHSSVSIPLLVRLRIRRLKPGSGMIVDTIVVSLGARG